MSVAIQRTKNVENHIYVALTFFTVAAACDMSIFPTRVDPVKPILRTTSDFISSSAAGRAATVRNTNMFWNAQNRNPRACGACRHCKLFAGQSLAQCNKMEACRLYLKVSIKPEAVS